MSSAVPWCKFDQQHSVGRQEGMNEGRLAGSQGAREAGREARVGVMLVAAPTLG